MTPPISASALLAYVRELSGDEFGGRLSGTPEYKAAADWVAALLKRWGLVPGGDNDTYLQAFPNPFIRVLPGGGLTLHGPVEKSYRYESDYFPGGTSASGRVRAEVAYAGYGITAPELGYDDYAGIDAAGKIVLVEPELPVASEFEPGFDPNSFLPWRPYSFHQHKLENAAVHGALGMLYNYGPISSPNNSYREGFVYSLVGDAVVGDLFSETGRTHPATVAEIRKLRSPLSFPTGKTVTIENITEYHPEGIGFNVIGIIPGSDPHLRDEALLIASHLDHCGRSWELLPGANDDASGVAVGLGLAEAFAHGAPQSRRPLLFVFFGGEEQGFLGSDHYCRHPRVPLARTAGMINMDLVGAGDRIFAYGGKNYPGFWSFFEKADREFVHRAPAPIAVANVGRPRLDGSLLASRGVPTVSFALVRSDGTPPASHNTKDTPDGFNPGLMADLARLLFFAVLDMSNQDLLNFR